MSVRPLPLMLFCALAGSSLAEEPFAKTGAAFLTKHCTSCHGAEKKKADLALHEFRDDTSVLKKRKLWKQIMEMVQEGEMPPDDKPQPADAEKAAFLASAKAVFANYDAKGKVDPGRVTLRRLNRNEYNNTLRDMLGIDAQPANDFPSDGVGYGFDNIGDVLSLSPLLMERFLDAAQTVAELAIPLETLGPPVKKLPVSQWEPVIAHADLIGGARELVLGADPRKAGPLTTPFKADPVDTYTIRTQLWSDAPAGRTVRMALIAAGSALADPQPVTALAPFEAEKGLQGTRVRVLKTFDVTARTKEKAQSVEFKLTGIAGIERLALALARDPAGAPPAKVLVKNITITGPDDTRTPFQKRWAKADAGKPPGVRTRTLLSYFMPRAWHRPVAQPEIERVAKVADAALARGDSWEGGVRLALISVLSSPKFLFRMEIDDQPENPEPHPINEFQLATRLSYFLWSSCPDDELLRYALTNQLTANLDGQIRRMLKDPRAEELVDNFAMQWLQLRRLNTHQADPKTFERWKPTLKDSMLSETRLFFSEIIREDRSVLDLLDADFTYLDRRLGEIYNLKPPGGFDGEKFRRVSLTGSQRGGLLTQASILTVTSNPTRTSPVKRGKWILEQLLGDPPPPPPAAVPSLDDQTRKELSGTFRQRLEQHRADPQCGNCHAKMDAMGFALENFDGIGQWREQNEMGQPIEVGGKLPKGGPELKSLTDLKKLLREEKDQFARCLSEKMLIYALGRGLEYYDDRALAKIQVDLAKGGYKFSALVGAIAKSDPFRLRRGKGQGDTP